MPWLWILIAIFALVAILKITNMISYSYLKNRTVNSRSWDLNICCGNTDGGGVNADIVKHSEVPNFVKIDDIENLPFDDGQFDMVLCSHTIEHVDKPDKFFAELSRIGKEVTLIIPPIWDISAAFNFLEHKWLYLTLKKNHSELPPKIRLPFSRIVQNAIGQKIKA
ncbi:MAG: class I SAM-dependent methyltransferase [Candidatus Zixiibacteriota bacterium]